MKKTIVLMLLVCVSVFPRTNAKVFALCYHTFFEKRNSVINFSTNKLHEQLTQLQHAGYRFVTLDDLYGTNLSGATNILVSIDDGYRTTTNAYYHVLKPMHIQPLLALYPSMISNGSAFLRWQDITELVSNGCFVAAHGYVHEHITKGLYRSNSNSFMKEIFTSRMVLEQKLSLTVDAFVYPYGLRDAFTVSNIKAAGYRCAFTIVQGPILIPLSNNKNVHELPRYMVTTNNWKSIYNQILSHRARPL